MEETTRTGVVPEELPTQGHTCTAVVEELVATTDESAWDEVEQG